MSTTLFIALNIMRTCARTNVCMQQVFVEYFIKFVNSDQVTDKVIIC